MAARTLETDNHSKMTESPNLVPEEHVDIALASDISGFYHDPLGFVRYAYPWGELGPLRIHSGPDKWQQTFLEDVGKLVTQRAFDGISAVEPVRMAVSSGHGIGKSVLVAWLVDWIMSTRPHSQGTITANTFPQLQTKTWAAIQHWTSMCITSHWFKVSGERMYHKDFGSTWFCSAQTCREENSEAFAGQHAAGSTSFYIADEASAIPDKIFEVAEGGLTDGEPMIFLFGNPTRNSGKFHRVTFGAERDKWNHRSIDSRECKFTNKLLINEWQEFYGEDSDFFRVRVRGLAPSAGELQFIDNERVWAAQKRPAQCLFDDPLIAGVDVARGGSDSNVIYFRKGFDGRTMQQIRIPGEATKDSTLLVSKLAEILSDKRAGHHIQMMFVDAAFGGPVVNRLHQLGHRNVQEINFGSASPDPHQANMRAFMWNKMKDWLLLGAIPPDQRLETDLTGPGFHHNKHDKLVLESKEQMAKRGLASPDDADALCLTFAQHVAPTTKKPKVMQYKPASVWS